MFNLSQGDRKKFEYLRKLQSDVANYHLTGDEFSGAIKFTGLESHVAAQSFATRLLETEVDLENEKHQRVLALALVVQQGPETWRQYDMAEQQTILNLLSIRYASEQRQQEECLSRVLDSLFDTQTIVDISGIGGLLASGNPYVLGLSTGINILIGRLADGNSFSGGANLEVVENLDKLDTGDIFVSGIKLQPDALQFVSKKHQISIDHIKQVLNAYGLKFEDLSQAQREQVRQLYARFHQKDKDSALRSKRDMKEVKEQIETLRDESRSERMLQREKERYYQRLNDARGFFRGLQGVASMIKDPKLCRNLQVVGCIGEQGINIASRAMELGGLIPGVAAPVGMAMLLPMANIAISAAVIIFSIFGKKKSERSPVMEALQTISKQIAELRKEMHERFDLIEEKLHKIAESMFEGFEQIKAIINFETGVIREMIQISMGRLQDDIDELTQIIESGHRELALIHFKDEIVAPISCYIDGTSTTVLDTTKVAILEENWLLGQFCSGIFAGKYFRKEQPYHQVARIAEKPVELVLGYLARFASERLGIQGIQEADLPSLDLWMENIGLALAARTALKLKDNKDIPLANLRKIQEKAVRSHDVIKTLRNATPKLYESLIALYVNGIGSIEKRILELMTVKAKEEVVTDTVALSSIKLQTIKGLGFPDLDAQHFLNALANQRVPRILVLAEQLGLGQWEANYQGVRAEGNAWNGPGGHMVYPTYRMPAMPIYHVHLLFRFKAKRAEEGSEKGIDIPILNATFKRHLETSSWIVRGLNDNHVNAHVYVPQYRAEQNNPVRIPGLLCGNWAASTVISGPTVCDYQAKVREQIAGITQIAWQKAKSQAPSADLKLTAEQKAFLDAVASIKDNSALFTSMVDQLKAVRALSLAYAQLLGLKEETAAELRKALNTDLTEFLIDPHLIAEIDDRLTLLLGNLSKSPTFTASQVLVKLFHASNIITLYERHLQQGLAPKDKLPDASLNALFIDWSKIEIEKDEECREICLGKGGFGTVYRARWNTESGSKVVAIKVINSDLGEDENTIFKAEIEKLSKLYSPHIVCSFGYSKREGRLCLVMELAKKGSLDKVLADTENKIASEQQALWVMQMARAIQYLHGNGIIHGDIKSLNVLLNENLDVKLNDFGLSSTTKQAKKTTITHSSKRAFGKSKGSIKSAFQSTQALGGSLLWQPPEAVTLDMDRLKPLSFAGDVYSFGVVIWEIFSRVMPFEALLNEHDAGFRIRMAILGDLEKNGKKLRRQDFDRIADDVPAAIKEIILGCWQRDPAKRPGIDAIVAKLNTAFPKLAEHLDRMAADHKKELEKPKPLKVEACNSSPMSFEEHLEQYRQFMRDMTLLPMGVESVSQCSSITHQFSASEPMSALACTMKSLTSIEVIAPDLERRNLGLEGSSRNSATSHAASPLATFSSPAKVDELTPQKTEGMGDCAFHASFGVWNESLKIYICPNVAVLRKQVADEIRSGTKSRANRAIMEAMQQMIIAERRGGKAFELARENFQKFLAQHEEQIRKAWEEFENVLKSYPDIIKFLNDNDSSERDLKNKVFICLQDDKNELYALILSLEDLHRKYKAYTRETARGFDWESLLQEQKLREEYAQLMERAGSQKGNGYWLLPGELEIVAMVFNKTIELQITDGKTGKRRILEIYNPEALGVSAQRVSVYFNGHNHYARMAAAAAPRVLFSSSAVALSEPPIVAASLESQTQADALLIPKLSHYMF